MAKYTRDLWYDRHARSWVSQLKDEDGNQVGDADYSGHKPKETAEEFIRKAKSRLKLESAVEQLVDALLEMAPATDEYYTSAVLYHGTSNNAEGEAILSSGVVRPGNTDKTTTRQYQPMAHRAYTTPDVKEGVINAIGGVVMGTTYARINGGFGWLFQVLPVQGRDVVPDEDHLGMIACDLLDPKKDSRSPTFKDFTHEVTNRLSSLTRERFKRFCQLNLTPREQQKVVRYEDFGHLTQVGKKLAQRLDKQNPDLLHALAKEGKLNLAVEGEQQVVHAWKITPEQVAKLLPDASNFFEVAEQVK